MTSSNGNIFRVTDPLWGESTGHRRSPHKGHKGTILWSQTYHCPSRYSDVIMGAMASQITSHTIVYSTVYSGADQRKHQSSASMAFVRGIHGWPMNSPHKRPITRKMFPFDDVIMVSRATVKNRINKSQGQLLQTWINIIKSGMKLRIISHRTTVQPLTFGNGEVISSHSLLDMWLLIHAGVKVNPC